MALTQRELNQALKIKRMSEQWPVTLDQNVLHTIQEQVKILETAQEQVKILEAAFKSHASVLQSAVRKIPNQWIRIPNQWVSIDMPPLIRNVNLFPLLSRDKAIQKGLPQINNIDFPSINLPTITLPPHNSMIASFPYTRVTFDNNSQYTNNEEEPFDSATDTEVIAEHNGRYHNYQWQHGQDWITVEFNLTAKITLHVANISSLLDGWVLRWCELVVWIVMEYLS